MKLVKMIGLGCVAAIASMALVAASPVMAENTALCTMDEEPCKESNLITGVHYEADNILIHTSIMDYECDALLSATVLKLGAPQVLDATSLQYTSCNQGCNRTVTSLGSFSVLRTTAELAKIAGNEFKIVVKCGIVLNCSYSFDELTGQVSGPLITGDNGRITYVEASLHLIGGPSCPGEAKLTALFKASNAVYVKS